MADAERDILAELEKALGEHIALILRWNRKLMFPDSPHPSEMDDDEHDCDFGAWYELNRNNRLIDQPAMHALAATHQQLHDSAKRLLSARAVDGEIDSAEFDMMALRAESFFAQLRRLERAFRTARSDVDPLTGTYNRQTMMGDLNSERERAIRTQVPTAIALVDGNRSPKLSCRIETVVRGDERCLSIAAASIIAKVTRDRIMTEIDRDYPAWGFASHKGYGTKAHKQALHQHPFFSYAAFLVNILNSHSVF